MNSEMPDPSPLTTRETALHLACAAAAFPFLGIRDARQLLDVVRCELSHEEILDDFQPYGNCGNPAGNHFAKAIPLRAILHIVSGNTPHAALQSLIRGLLIGSHNFCKLPSAGLSEVAQFRDLLPSSLAARLEISNELSDDWMTVSDAIIVFGDDATIAHFRGLARADQLFLAHGHKVSAGIVVSDAAFESVPHAARDASLFDQQGCLSPHAFYVAGSAENAREYASRLARAMADFQTHTPRGKLAVSDAAAIREVREAFAFRAAHGEAVEVFASADSTDWTVIFEANPTWRTSCLNRAVFVKPLTAGLDEAFAPVRPWLSTVGLWPATLENARRFASLGASRFCRIGEMQSPSFAWHQDGAPTLAELVRWVDFSA